MYLQKRISTSPTSCWQCKKEIKEGANYFYENHPPRSLAPWDVPMPQDDWCLECGEKQKQESESKYQQRLDRLWKMKVALFKTMLYSTGVYIFILGTQESLGLAFLGALVTMLVLFLLNKEELLDFTSLEGILGGVVFLYIATTFSIPAFCWAQDLISIEWLSETMCSGTLILPGYMGL